MSKKLFFIRQALRYVFLLPLASTIACDPCYDLGRQLCECEETESARKACIANLSLAKSHKYFDVARDPQVCSEAIKNCSCRELQRGQDGKCGFYRTTSNAQGE